MSEVIAGRSVVAFPTQRRARSAIRKVFRLRTDLRSKASSAIMGVVEVARDARESTGRLHVGRRRRCPPRAAIPTSVERAPTRLVPHRYAANRPAATGKGSAAGAARDRSRRSEAVGEYQAFPLAWEHSRSPRTANRPFHRSEHNPGTLRSSRKGCKRSGGFRDLHKNNSEFISNLGERWRQGERISTAFVESTINQVVSRRFVKKQQMHWTLRGAHLLLQTRTKVLNNELEGAFRKWYPQFRPQAA